MPGLFLNSYPLTFHGQMDLHEIRGACESYTRDELREIAGVQIWMGDRDAFAYDAPATSLEGVQVIAKDLAPPDGLVLWAARGALVAYCTDKGYDAWFGRHGEMHVIGMIEAMTEDRFLIEQGIVMRISQEEYADAHAILTIRPRTRWLCRDSLADSAVAARAVGRRVVRLVGGGPRSGVVLRIDGDEVALRVGDDETIVAAADYTITVNAAVIANWRGSDVLRAVRVNTGELTATGNRNRHGVEDRFKRVGISARKLGPKIPVSGGGKIEIAQRAVAIRLEDR